MVCIGLLLAPTRLAALLAPTRLAALRKRVLLPLGVLVESVLGAELLPACAAHKVPPTLCFVPAADVSEPKRLAAAPTCKFLSAMDCLVVLQKDTESVYWCTVTS